ncbi:hexokinase [Treponema pectinovorum]|uniref:hexokinase n=1 Tax=Treponema pectinovorum TaxID=164 RepID=UPI003D8F51FA
MNFIFNTLFLQKFVVKSFLKRHHFYSKMIVDEILTDMKKPKPKKSGQDMSETWMSVPQKDVEGKKVIVIDAGGTNFRSCLISFGKDGNPEITEYRKNSMPALEREYSKDEFFSAIADRIDYLKDKAQKIGFCFSYSLDMTRNHDAIVNALSKEVKARSIIGLAVGKCLKEELLRRGWKSIEKITVCNDTVSALLAGKSALNEYDSYIGFILGTGMNAAFVDYSKNTEDGQIIVCESGKCDTFQLSDFDMDADLRTAVPHQFPLEKCCSGAYLGNTVLSVLYFAAREGLFSPVAAKKLLELKELSTIEADDFLQFYKTGKFYLPKDSKNPISLCCANKKDIKIAFLLIDSCVDRCAHYAASILAAALVTCGKGKSPEKKVCIVCNGTTFYKTFKVRERIEKYLYRWATKKRGIHFETIFIQDDIIIGTARAGLLF